nr:hypothetical protein [Tanacetum cinerariifolium]
MAETREYNIMINHNDRVTLSCSAYANMAHKVSTSSSKDSIRYGGGGDMVVGSGGDTIGGGGGDGDLDL